jgi:hypothetical protein
MSKQEEETEPELDLDAIVLKFMEDHKQAISDGLREWAKSGRRRGIMLIAVMVFLGGTVLFTGLLTYVGSLPGEAFTFLVGTILMYLFNLIGPRVQIG